MPRFGCRGYLLSIIVAESLFLSGVASASTTSVLKKEIFAFTPSGTSLDTLGAAGIQEVRINDGTDLLLPGGGCSPIVSLGESGGYSRVGVEARVGNFWTQGFAQVADRALVDGFLQAEGSVEVQCPPENLDDVIPGGLFTGVEIAAVRPAHVVDFPLGGTVIINVEPSQSVTIQPGVYSTLDAKADSDVFLSEGDYFFTNASIGSGARLHVDTSGGQVIVHTKDTFTYRGEVVSSGGALRDFLVLHLGSQTVNVETAWRGTLWAPYAKLDVKSSSLGHAGAFYGRLIEVHQHTTIDFDPFPITDIFRGFNASDPANTTCEATAETTEVLPIPTRGQMIEVLDEIEGPLDTLIAELSSL